MFDKMALYSSSEIVCLRVRPFSDGSLIFGTASRIGSSFSAAAPRLSKKRKKDISRFAVGKDALARPHPPVLCDVAEPDVAEGQATEENLQRLEPQLLAVNRALALDAVPGLTVGVLIVLRVCDVIEILLALGERDPSAFLLSLLFLPLQRIAEFARFIQLDAHPGIIQLVQPVELHRAALMLSPSGIVSGRRSQLVNFA